jgi:hypothetical protein
VTVYYRLSAYDHAGNHSEYSTVLDVTVMWTDLGLAIPDEFALRQNYPNPFNPETWIPFELEDRGEVVVSIYNLNGSLIRQIQFGQLSAGKYLTKDKAAYWDGRNQIGERVSNGLYFYQLQTGTFQQTKKLIVIQ